MAGQELCALVLTECQRMKSEVPQCAAIHAILQNQNQSKHTEKRDEIGLFNERRVSN